MALLAELPAAGKLGLCGATRLLAAERAVSRRRDRSPYTVSGDVPRERTNPLALPRDIGTRKTSYLGMARRAETLAQPDQEAVWLSTAPPPSALPK